MKRSKSKASFIEVLVGRKLTEKEVSNILEDIEELNNNSVFMDSSDYFAGLNEIISIYR